MEKVREQLRMREEDISSLCARKGHEDSFPIEIGAEMGSWEYCPSCKAISNLCVEYTSESGYKQYRINKE